MYNLTQTILTALRNQGIDVPTAVNEAAANAHFGEELAEGKRYYCPSTETIKVYDGHAWIVQKTS